MTATITNIQSAQQLLTDLCYSAEMDATLRCTSIAEDLRDDLRQETLLAILEHDAKNPGYLESRTNLRGTIVAWLRNLAKPEGKVQRMHRTQSEKPFDIEAVDDSSHANEDHSGSRINGRARSKAIAGYEVADESESIDYEALIAACPQVLERVTQLTGPLGTPYYADLFKLYVKLGTYRKVSEATGIPLRSVYNAIRTAKIKMQTDLWALTDNEKAELLEKEEGRELKERA